MNDMPKPLIWMGSSLKDFREFPTDVMAEMGYGLHQAQSGERHRNAKTLSGFGSASVVEIIDDHRNDTFRTVYTIKFSDTIYVLHAFQKKSKSGISTPQTDMKLIEVRLREAEKLDKKNKESKNDQRS